MITPRQQAREQMVRDLVRVGRTQLRSVLPADLSLRAVARELGVVPSALYRYVRNRDDLLTLLIIDAYDELGDEVDAAVNSTGSQSHRRQLEAAVLALRSWALREPSRFALLYGTPVPGYQAPSDQTFGPGTRVIAAFARVIDGAWRAGALSPVDAELPPAVDAFMQQLRSDYDIAMPAANVARTYGLWSAAVGAVLFETFGQYGSDLLDHREEFLRFHIAGLAETVGL